MNSKSVEYFQQEHITNENELVQTHPNPNPIPIIDSNYIIFDRTIKYILNFLFIYLFVTLIIYNFPQIQIHVFIILICAISSVAFYILDLNFPSCYV